MSTESIDVFCQMIPMMEGRLSAGMELYGTRTPPEHADAVRTPLKGKPIDAFHRFYADTATFGSQAAIECGLRFFGVDRMLFATDMPFDPEQGPGFIDRTLRALNAMNLTGEERAQVLSLNARRLLNLKVSNS